MLKRLISVGIQQGQSSSQKFRIIMINIIVMLIIGLSATYSLLHVVVGDSIYAAIALLLCLVIAAAIFLANYLKKFYLTEFLLHFLFPIWVVSTSVLYGRDYQMESYLILSGLGALFIFTNHLKAYYFMTWSFILFFGTRIYFIFHPESLVPLTDKALPYLYILNGLAPIIAVGILVDRTFKHNKLLYRKLKDVSDNQEKIINERTKEVKKQAIALEISNQELKRFSYISAHDLREPLRNIMSFSQLLERDLDAQEFDNIKEYLNYINSGIKRIDSLTNDIVSYTELEEYIPKVEWVDTDFIVGSVLAGVGQAQEMIDLKVETLPKIKINGQMCHLLFSNLINNAIQYCDKSSPYIRISAIKKDKFYQFEIQDNGKGIAPEYHKTIFEMFKRLHNDLNKSGSGIGLAICKKIVNAYGGEIWVKSVEGAGSTFCFTLPAG